MPELKAIQPRPQRVNQNLLIPGKFPELPASIRRRFGDEAVEYDEAVKSWWSSTKRVLVESYEDVATPHNETRAAVEVMAKTVKAGDAVLKASIKVLNEIVVDADSALAQRTTTIEATINTAGTGLLARLSTVETAYVAADSALAQRTTTIEATINTAGTGLLARLSTVETAYVAADSALAQRTSNIEASINTAGTGILARVSTIEGAYVDATEASAISSSVIQASIASNVAGTIGAAVSAEATARATTDGKLAGGYKLTVAAGGVVTGMQLSAARDLVSGETSSEITFLTSTLKIVAPGVGATPITVATVDSNAFVFGTDIKSINFAAGTAGWRLTRAGNFEANNAVFRGTIYAGDGTIGGFTIGPTGFSSSAGGAFVSLSSSGDGYLQLGVDDALADYTANRIAMWNDGQYAVKIAQEAGDGLIKVYNDGVEAISLNGTNGVVTASGGFSGSGASLSGLSASNISGGTLADARLPASIYKKLELNPAGAHGELGCGETPGSDAAFTTYLACFINGRTLYVPFRSSLA